MMAREPSTAPEQMSLLFDVWLLMHLVSGRLDEVLAGTGLTADDFGLYSLLRVFGPATPTQIARWTGMRPTTVSAALRRTAAREHSQTRPNPADRRSYLVALSPAGATAHRLAAEPFLTELSQVGEATGPDERDLRLALQRLDTALRTTSRLDPRPYTVSASRSTPSTVAGSSWNLPYDGEPLDREQELAALQYLDFLRSRGRP